MRKLILILIPILTSSCWYIDEGPAEFPAGEVIGYKPIYAEQLEEDIKFIETQPLQSPGKIYSYGNYLLVNELYKGVHVIDNSDVTTPKIVGFLSIAGNIDVAIKGNYLFADHLGDLVTIDISAIENPVITDRVENLYDRSASLPPLEQRYFECVDPLRQHLVRDWVLVPLLNPECYR